MHQKLLLSLALHFNQMRNENTQSRTNKSNRTRLQRTIHAIEMGKGRNQSANVTESRSLRLIFDGDNKRRRCVSRNIIQSSKCAVLLQLFSASCLLLLCYFFILLLISRNFTKYLTRPRRATTRGRMDFALCTVTCVVSYFCAHRKWKQFLKFNIS